MYVAEMAHVLEFTIVVHPPRISQRHLVDLCCKLSSFFLDLMSLEYPDTNQIWISGRYDGLEPFPKNYNIGPSKTDKVDVMANTPSQKIYYCSILIEEVGHLSIRIS